MTARTRTRLVARTLLLALFFALGVAVSTQAAVACSDTAARYPMLIGSGYEGERCDVVTVTLVNRPAARTTSPTWHETMLDGSGYEIAAIEATRTRQVRD